MRTSLLLGCLLGLGCGIITDLDGTNDRNTADDIKDTTPPSISAIQSGLIELCSTRQGANPCINSVSPSNVSFTDPIQIFFSESLDEDTIVTDTAFLVEGVVDEAFLADADSPPLTASRRELLHPTLLSLAPFAGSEKASVIIAPLEPLEKQTLYTLVLSSDIRDVNGAPLVDALGLSNAFSFTFTTGNQGSPIASLVFPSAADGQAEAQNVPTNVPRAVLLFSQPVLGVVNGGVDQGKIQLLGGDALPVNISVQDGVVANVAECNTAAISQCFSININEELLPNAAQQLQILKGITDTNGAALVGSTTFRFTTGAGPDDEAPQFLAGPDATPQDVSATISFTTNEAAVGAVRFGQGALTDEVITTVTDVGGEFLHQAVLSSLTSETNFLFEARVTDFAGNTTLQSGSFTTAPPLAKLVITEVMANPQSASESSEEFIEIFNADINTIDLTGMILHRIQNGVPISNIVLGAATLPPGAFAVVGGSTFAPVNINTGAALVLKASASLSLSNSTDDGYTLESVGFILSTFTNFLPHDCNGRSIERSNVNQGDVAANLVYSDDASGATPGRANSGSTDQTGNVCF
jgi:hypothetical protein